MAAQKISSVVVSMVATVSELVAKNKKKLFWGGIVAIVCAMLLFLYNMWSDSRNASAQRVLGNLIESHERAVANKNVDLDNVIKQFQEGYEQNSSSNVAAYFLGYQVDLLIQQNKKDEARIVLDNTITQLCSSPLVPLYKMKRALIKLDNADETTKKEGKAELEALAYDKTNQFKDSALFYLGQYYWFINDIDSARKVWQTLIDEQPKATLFVSPWVDLAKKYLAVKIV